MLYDSIKICPIVNYQNVLIDNDFSHLVKGEVKKSYDLEGTFKKLNDELVDTFGVGEEYEKVFWLQYGITKLKLQMLITDDKTLQNEIRNYEHDLANVKIKKQEGDLARIFASNHRELSKWAGRDTRKLTMFEYYNDLADSQKDGKKN